MPPTELYNEGWLLRLVLDWFSRHPETEHPLSVPADGRWYSEALLASQFLPRWRGDPLAESYTHADAAIGHFDIGNSGEGDLLLRPNARHFVVVEAKLGSRLSGGTKNAPGYDQAARNVACTAHTLSRCGRRPEETSRLGFFVVAPASQISRGVFDHQLSKGSIREKVSQRVAAYQDPDREAWLRDWFNPALDQMGVEAISWEEVLNRIGEKDPESTEAMRTFYLGCLKYNRLDK